MILMIFNDFYDEKRGYILEKSLKSLKSWSKKGHDDQDYYDFHDEKRGYIPEESLKSCSSWSKIMVIMVKNHGNHGQKTTNAEMTNRS